MSKQEKGGWGFPLKSRKAHYFVGPWSICRKWLYVGKLEQGNDSSPDNCKICMRMLIKRKKMEGIQIILGTH